jgi:hypothetical protein
MAGSSCEMFCGIIFMDYSLEEIFSTLQKMLSVRKEISLDSEKIFSTLQKKLSVRKEISLGSEKIFSTLQKTLPVR